MKKLKVYLDTSIINFLFAVDSPEYMQITIDFFDHYITDYDIFISEIVLLEIWKSKNAQKREQLLSAIQRYRLEVYDTLTGEIEELAREYIEAGVIQEKNLEDALHLAFSTFYEFDILLSWNFRHLANIKKQIAVNSINEREGFLKELYLLSPMEVIYEK